MLEIEIRVWNDGHEIDNDFFYGDVGPEVANDAKIWLANVIWNMKEDE